MPLKIKETKGYRIKITLPMDGEMPDVVRTVDIPSDITFKQLHDTIQTVMGWDDAHLYEFLIRQQNITIPEDSLYEEMKNQSPIKGIKQVKVRRLSNKIDKYLQNYRGFEYIYDLGDNWEHTIELIRLLDDYAVGYPKVISGQGNLPPEDSGGVGGWLMMLESLNDPDDPEHEDIVKWLNEIDYLPDGGKLNKKELNDYLKKYFWLKKKV